jgi:large subunit ribosomal protein L23
MNVRPDRTTKYTKSGLISGKTNAIKKQLFKYKKEKQLILQQYLR